MGRAFLARCASRFGAEAAAKGMPCWAMDLDIKALPTFGIAGEYEVFGGWGLEVIEFTQKTLKMSASPV
jgi:hypothetical protein